jgi:hypothetical protein
MSGLFKGFLGACARFFAGKSRRRFALLLILGLAALIEFFVLGLARRTFMFFPIDGGALTVEDRMLKRDRSKERELTRYVEEAVLGPVSPGLLALFPRGTRLRSVLFREGVVYVDFSEEAALAPDGGEHFRDFYILYSGIKRNFPFVNDTRFFIEGRAAYFEEFLEISQEIFVEENKKSGNKLLTNFKKFITVKYR